MPDNPTLDQLNLDRLPDHKQCKHCFMTGKACIYQHDIRRTSPGSMAGGEAPRPKAFLIMPFATTLTPVYFDQLEPCVRAKIPRITRADDVMRTGFAARSLANPSSAGGPPITSPAKSASGT